MPQITPHHIGPAHHQPPTARNARDRFQITFQAGQQPPDRAWLLRHRAVDRDHGAGLRDAITLQDAPPELVHIKPHRVLMQPFRAGHDIFQRIKIKRMGMAGITLEKGIGAEQDGGLKLIDEFRDQAVMQRGRV